MIKHLLKQIYLLEIYAHVKGGWKGETWRRFRPTLGLLPWTILEWGACGCEVYNRPLTRASFLRHLTRPCLFPEHPSVDDPQYIENIKKWRKWRFSIPMHFRQKKTKGWPIGG